MAKYIDREELLADIAAAAANGGMGEIVAKTLARYVKRQPTADVVAVWGKLICDPLSADKPEAIGPEVRRKAREILMEELEAKGLIRYQMLNGVLYAGIRVAAPEDKT